MTSRREFLKFMGASGVTLHLDSVPVLASKKSSSPTGLKPHRGDDLVVASGLSFQILCTEQDPINNKGDRFGCDADFTTYIPLNSSLPHDGFLWVNHEDVHPGLLHEFKVSSPRIKEQIDYERSMVGGSLLRVRRESQTGQWKLIMDDPRSRRLSATTPIPFAGGVTIAGKTMAQGTLANCSGGKTPWGSILTCEEVYRNFYGERNFHTGAIERQDKGLQWGLHYPEPPEHYGWVVEISPQTGVTKKLVSLGRFQHEGVATIVSKLQTLVCYMGDDQEDQCLYKFIASKPGNLEEGTLYVANLDKREWIPLVRDANPLLSKLFKDQLELLIRTQEASKAVGGTPLNRPEGIAIHPQTKDVFIALAGSKVRKDPYGSILKLKEKDADPLSLSFEFSHFTTGGPQSDFACPDNLTFDRKGNLWMTSDFGAGSEGFESLGNNSLYYIPLSGPQAGSIIRMASSPMDAELTGPSFSFDGKTLFLSVQHPGVKSRSRDQLTSHWPQGDGAIPRSAVVAISGPQLTQLTN